MIAKIEKSIRDSPYCEDEGVASSCSTSSLDHVQVRHSHFASHYLSTKDARIRKENYYAERNKSQKYH